MKNILFIVTVSCILCLALIGFKYSNDNKSTRQPLWELLSHHAAAANH